MNFLNLDSITDGVVKAWLNGTKRLRIVLAIAAAFFFVGGAIILVSEVSHTTITWLKPLGFIIASPGVVVVMVVGFLENLKAKESRRKIIEQAEERVREHPHEPQAAWDLARVKLESYLDRNLRQVNWIFVLTLVVMTAGFLIIGYGVIRVYQSPDNFKPSIVVTVSGVLVEFIAATFLFIYRSTMEQARSYVTMLEKINAVGMSIHILDSTKGADVDKFRAQIAIELLNLYGSPKPTKRGRTSTE